MKSKIYSGIDTLPHGDASDKITPGCLVSEGGAFRGVYAQGVMDALMENDINMQCAVGVSAGAMSALNYVTGQIGRSGRINLRYRHDKRYVGARNFVKNRGLIGFDFVFYNVPSDPLNEKRLHDPSRRFVAVATNCETGKTEYLEQSNCSDIFKAIQASASMPYISKMVKLDGKLFLDGACSVKIPYEWALQQGYEKIIVIKTRHKSFRYESTEESRLPYKVYHNYPAFADSYAHMHATYNRECDEIEDLDSKGRIFVISPSKTESVKRLEPDMEKLGAHYYMGYNDAKSLLPRLKEYLSD